MRRLVIRGLAERKVRSMLTGIAVALGVGLVSGTFILTDTIQTAFDSILRIPHQEASAVVTARHDHMRPGAESGVLSDDLLQRITALPEVADAHGTILDLASGGDPVNLLDPAGRAIDDGPTFALGIDPEAERFNPFTLDAGRWAARDGEVVLDAETASRYSYGVGGSIGFVGRGPEERFTIVGLARFEGVSTMGGAAIAIFDVETAQRLHGTEDFTAISVAAADGVTGTQLLEAIRPLLPPLGEVRTGEQQAAVDADAAASVRAVRAFLLAFAVLALLVAAFVIANSFSITVAQRTRELATLRLLGASRRQVHRTVVSEGLMIGAVASVVGIGLGFALSEGLVAVFRLMDLQMPKVATVFEPRTILVSLAAGLGVTWLAVRTPARKATKVPPLAALRDTQLGVPPPRRRRDRLAALLLTGAAVLGASGLLSTSEDAVEGRVRAIVLAGVLSFVAAMLLAPRLIRPVAGLVSRPMALLGRLPSSLARRNTVRNARRTASTVAAMTLGLALSTLAVVVGDAVVSSGESSIRSQLRAPYIVGLPNGWQGGSADLSKAVKDAAGITEAASVRTVGGGLILEDGRFVNVSGVSAASLPSVYRFEWRAGSDAAAEGLGSTGALVTESLARSRDLRVGDELQLSPWQGEPVTTVVRGIFADPTSYSLLGDVVMDESAFGELFPMPVPTLILVAADGPTAVEAAVRPFDDAEVLTPRQVAEARNRELMIALRVLSVLLMLVILISLTGMVNSLVLSVVERRRELGLLRAVGMSRRQLRSMIRHEAVLTSLLGAALGVPMGLLVGVGIVTSLEPHGIHLSVPIASLTAILFGTVLLGLLASVIPARWASRRGVIEAFSQE